MLHTNVLVIGSGAAGLSYALKVASDPNIHVTIITKTNRDECNTRYAQGGIAVVMDLEKDNFEKHIQDTLRAGDGACNLESVEVVVKEATQRINELIELGTNFDKNGEGVYDLGREGGHSENRIMHYKDITGGEIERALLAASQKPNITFLENNYVIDLITDQEVCYGVLVFNEKTNEVSQLFSAITVLATGGTGHVYRNTTNPIVATGDGIGIAYRAGAHITNMQYIQFHPTVFYREQRGRLPLISEAVRGFGAKLKTKSGESFMHKYDEREELASRDIVARAIFNEMKLRGDSHVCLDCTHLNHEKFMVHFPNIYNQCIEDGYDLFQELIPVVPASHYLCGGINVDLWGQTNIQNLFAIGECSNTGLHGANRLASNSLLEAIVFGNRAAIRSIEKIKKGNFNKSKRQINLHYNSDGTDNRVECELLRTKLQDMMSNLVGIVRCNNELNTALQEVHMIRQETKNLFVSTALSQSILELNNLSDTALLIIQHSLSQKSNKGAFYNKDL